MEPMNERCCPKPKRYRPDFYVKELKKVWPADEEMKHELRLYDEAHSKKKCINKEYYNHLEKELFTYAIEKKDRVCEESKDAMLQCLKDARNISFCTDKIDHFLTCVNSTIKKAYAPKID